MKLAQQADRFLQKAANDDRLLPSHISLYMAMFYYSTDKPGDYFQVSRKKLMRGDSDESDHSNPAQADHPFRAKLTT